MVDIFENPNFDDFKHFVMHYWRPNTEAAVLTTDKATIYSMLDEWFKFLEEDPNFEYPDDLKIDIGPYIGIYPYAKHKLDKTDDNGNPQYEFLFIYDNVDNSKMTKTQLSLGRGDFVDVFQPEMVRNSIFKGSVSAGS